VILPSILQSHKERIRELLNVEFEGPHEHAVTFEQYAILISKQVRENFLAFDFCCFTKMIYSYEYRSLVCLGRYRCRTVSCCRTFVR
jgi:hypothetical protein